MSLINELLEMAKPDPKSIFKFFTNAVPKGWKDHDVKDIGKMSEKEIEEYNDSMDPDQPILWMHVAGGLLGAKKFSDMMIVDSEGLGDESEDLRAKQDDVLDQLANHGLFKKEKEVDLDNYEYGFGSIDYGSVLGVPCVEVSDHGMLAYVVLKKDIKA